MLRGVLFDLGDTLIDDHPLPPGQRDEDIARDLEIWLRRRSMRGGDEFTPDERARLSEVDGMPLVAAVNQGLTEVAMARWASGREAGPGEVFGRLQAELAASTGLVASPSELEEVYVRSRMSHQRVLPGALELLADLRARGLRVGVLSNTAFSREAMDAYLRAQGLLAAIDVVSYSSEIGWRKPRVQAFRAALSRLGARPAETAFVGDNPEADIAGAINAGISAIWLWGNRPGADGLQEEVSVAADAAAGEAGDQVAGVWPAAEAGSPLAEESAAVRALAGTGRLLGAARTLEQVGALLARRQ